MELIIFIAAIMVVATIALSLVTAYDLQRQRDQLAGLETALLEMQKEEEETELQRAAAAGTQDMVARLLQEKKDTIEALGVELEELKVERVGDHTVKSKVGGRVTDPLEDSTEE